MGAGIFEVIAYSFCLLIIGFMFFTVFIKDDGQRYSVRILFAYTFVLKVIISIFLLRYIISKHGDPYLAIDTESFAGMAAKISEVGLWSYEGYIPNSWEKMPHIYSLVFDLTGNNAIFLILTWLLVASLIAIPVYHITYSIYNRKSAYVSSAAVLVYPSFVALSVAPQKGILTAFSICLIVLALIKNKLSIRYISLFLFGSFLLACARSEMLFVISMSAAIWVLYRKSYSGSARVTWRLVLYLGLLFLLSIYVVGTGYLLDLVDPESIRSRISLVQGKAGASAGVQDFVINQNIFIRSVLGPVFLMIKPFPPWQTLSTLTLSALLTTGALSLYFISPYILGGTWSALAHKNTKLLVLIIILTLLVSSAFMGAVTSRHRVQIMPLLLVFFAGGFVNKTVDKFHLFVYYIMFVLFVGLYISVKAVT